MPILHASVPENPRAVEGRSSAHPFCADQQPAGHFPDLQRCSSPTFGETAIFGPHLADTAEDEVAAAAWVAHPSGFCMVVFARVAMAARRYRTLSVPRPLIRKGSMLRRMANCWRNTPSPPSLGLLTAIEKISSSSRQLRSALRKWKRQAVLFDRKTSRLSPPVEPPIHLQALCRYMLHMANYGIGD